jgi:hypothetical protein
MSDDNESERDAVATSMSLTAWVAIVAFVRYLCLYQGFGQVELSNKELFVWLNYIDYLLATPGSFQHIEFPPNYVCSTFVLSGLHWCDSHGGCAGIDRSSASIDHHSTGDFRSADDRCRIFGYCFLLLIFHIQFLSYLFFSSQRAFPR